MSRLDGLARLAASIALCAALGACGPSSASSTATQRENEPSQLLEAETPFLQRISRAPETVAHSGVRRISYAFDVGGSTQRLSYTERVAANGHGRFAIEPLALEEPHLGSLQRSTFEEVQRARAGFFFKYRDVRIRDVPLFLENYRLTQLETQPKIADLPCVELAVRKRDATYTSYVLAIHAETGLVLRAIEYDPSGTEVSRSEFQEISLTPDLTGVEFFEEQYPGTPLTADGSNAGMPVAGPQILPPGFREISSDVLEVAGSRVVRRIWGDGLENLFFLQRRALVPNVAPITEPGVVRVAQLGPWTIAELHDREQDFFVLGRITSDAVMHLLQSAR